MVADVEKYFMDLLVNDKNLSAGIGAYITHTFLTIFIHFQFYQICFTYSGYKNSVSFGGENQL